MPYFRSQLNGINGEATNTDDLPSKTDKRQNAHMRAIENRLDKLALALKSKQKGQSGKKKNRKTPKTRTPFPGLPSNNMKGQSVVVSPDPLVHSIVAQFNPFRTQRGVSSGLSSARPSQKFTARGVMSISPAANQQTVIFVCPAVINDAVGSSARSFTGNTAALTSQLTSLTALQAGVTSFSLNTNTPYSSAVLAGKDFAWRLVSAGVRIRNVTAAVSRQGMLLTYFDHDHTLLPHGMSGISVASYATAISSNHRTVRVNMASKPDTELVLSSVAHSYSGWSEVIETPSPAGSANTFYAFSNFLHDIGGYYGGIGGGFIVLPSVASSQSYEIEVIEHWEISGSAIETLHTPSPSHAMASELVSNVIKQAHHQHALTPELAIHDVAKGVIYAQHHKTALKEAASVATAVALL